MLSISILYGMVYSIFTPEIIRVPARYAPKQNIRFLSVFASNELALCYVKICSQQNVRPMYANISKNLDKRCVIREGNQMSIYSVSRIIWI